MVMTMGIKSVIKTAFPIMRRTKSENGVEKTCAPHRIHKETQLQETATPPNKNTRIDKSIGTTCLCMT